MAYEVSRPELERRVSLYLETTDGSWSCRDCIANSLAMTLNEVKLALLGLARSRRRSSVDFGREVCEACGMETAVVRLGPNGSLRGVA